MEIPDWREEAREMGKALARHSIRSCVSGMPAVNGSEACVGSTMVPLRREPERSRRIWSVSAEVQD